MKQTSSRVFAMAVAGVLSAAAASVLAADPPKPTTDQPAAAATKEEGGASWTRKVTKDLPKTRTGGSTSQKGIDKSDAALFFVAPKSTGFTTKDLPEIYWYISQPSKAVTFTLVDDRTKKTELRLIVKDVQPGFHKLDLAKVGKDLKFGGLEANAWNPATGGGGGEATAAAVKAVYRMALKSTEPLLLASAYIARVQGAAGQANDYNLQIKNELWFDAIGSLASQLSTEGAKQPAPRKQFGQLLEAEEVLRSDVGETASAEQKKRARAEEEKVIGKLSVPDPIDLQSDKWEPKSVPDPIDLN